MMEMRQNQLTKNQKHNPTQNMSVQKSPTLKQGYNLLFDHPVKLDMKYIDYDRQIKHLGSDEVINFKIYTFGLKPNIVKVKIQLDSDSDPFFSSVFETDQHMFEILRDQQKFNFDLQEFPTVLIKSLNKIEQSQGKVNASALIHSDGKCRLRIWQSSQYKNIEIMCLDFSQQNEDNIQTKALIKYEDLRKKVIRTEERLMKINQIIKEKNPSLLMQLQKTTTESQSKYLKQ